MGKGKAGRPTRFSRETLESWLPFLKGHESTVVRTILEEGSRKEAAKTLHITPSSLARAVNRAWAQAQRNGLMPEFGSIHPVPPGLKVKGISSNVDENGIVKQSWVKLTEDPGSYIKMLMENLEACLEDMKFKSTAPRKVSTLAGYDKDVMTWYPIGDHHFGMYSWAEESGSDYDTQIAERLLTAAIDRLVDSAPNSRSAAILNVGDFFHMDSSANETVRSGNRLDVDTRWAKVVQVGVRALRYCIDRALEKHQTVYVYNVMGNHDIHSAQALSMIMAAFYEGNPRVVVPVTANTFQYHEFGRCLVGMHHGDNIKRHEDFVAIMARDQAEAWGRTKFRYWWLGHVHHTQRKELMGAIVETFRTLAAKDAWHSSMGYSAGRDMTAIVIHKDYGEIERHTVPVQQIEDQVTP